jgi:hypothetical protein
MSGNMQWMVELLRASAGTRNTLAKIAPEVRRRISRPGALARCCRGLRKEASLDELKS